MAGSRAIAAVLVLVGASLVACSGGGAVTPATAVPQGGRVTPRFATPAIVEVERARGIAVADRDVETILGDSTFTVASVASWRATVEGTLQDIGLVLVVSPDEPVSGAFEWRLLDDDSDAATGHGYAVVACAATVSDLQYVRLHIDTRVDEVAGIVPVASDSGRPLPVAMQCDTP